MNPEKDRLEFLAQRLEGIPCDDLHMAATLVRRVMASTAGAMEQDAEHALFHAVWDYVSRSLDHGEFDPAKYFQQVEALESEMAGRVLSHRLRRGWISRSNSSPDEFRHIDEFL